jgi:citronellol/citronellal dehydrogenase
MAKNCNPNCSSEKILGGDNIIAKSRIPAIMSDSAHVILTSCSKSTTDNLFMDDEVLISNDQTIDDLQNYMPVQ